MFFNLYSKMTLVPSSKVITKNKVGSLTMQPAKHDVTGMPLYRMYSYPILVQEK